MPTTHSRNVVDGLHLDDKLHFVEALGVEIRGRESKRFEAKVGSHLVQDDGTKRRVSEVRRGHVAFDLLRDALSAIFGLSKLSEKPQKGCLGGQETEKGAFGLREDNKGVFGWLCNSTKLKRIELITTSNCPDVLGGDTCEGHIFITARVFLEGTPARGTNSLLPGLTNRWLSMKKDIASCGSKYLAYLEVEVEYQGSSGLLWVLKRDFTSERCSMFGKKDKLEPSYVGPFEILGWIGPIVRQFLFDELRVLMPRVVKSRDEIFSRWGYCDNHDLSRLDNQSIERDRLIGIGFVLNFVKFISFTFGDKEMISVIEAVSR
ncbi:hypothetical protein Tco_0591920 [Tanacetum coccineum]